MTHDDLSFSVLVNGHVAIDVLPDGEHGAQCLWRSPASGSTCSHEHMLS